ncbi:clathrin-mediated endocytosis regulator UBX3 NDAI_0B03140 [Naumovozyma dairenensis CBS 421]|uniref:UBX domain-containing protein n=1 Tax=Naumovozyma dairenensis (strain ATCC 10597 / BCRC 20456 / CBS 421 / NBRC 0211 / NRRL Y-12639) TaxID=1071378 RepID=G0W6D8_NAUDC|nr:hypothetical protein NDAI_0B03140 [Naumovozyma dairenensis CBS 421]CCD23349.1 hypothetical protein NDAI_0B03140 [Naumovozyma dairenensis CBS 421]
MNFINHALGSSNASGPDFVRSIPGAFPNQSRNGNSNTESGTNHNNGSTDGATAPSRSLAFFKVIYRIPLLLLFYFMKVSLVLFTTTKSFLKYEEFYKKAKLEHKVELNDIIDTISNQAIPLDDNSSYTFASLYSVENGRFNKGYMRDSYTDLLAGTSDQATFGMIYLHDPLLDDPMQYVNDILCTEPFITLIQKFQMLLWIGDVTKSEGLQVANSLKVRKFPFLGFITLKNESKVELVKSYQGSLIECDYSSQSLENILTKAYPKLVNIRQQRQNQAMESLIREQQDARYQTSLNRDQERERRRVQAREREQMERHREIQERQWLLWRKARLHPEPVGNEINSSRIALRVDGNRVVRKFDSSLPIEEIYAYAELYSKGLLEADAEYDSHDEYPSGYDHEYTFKLVCLAPRKELDPSTIISEEPLIYPSGNVVIEDIGEI